MMQESNQDERSLH